jgi:tellurite resistance protein
MIENESRLKHFPAPLFAIVMGLGGLTIVYQKAGEILGYPTVVGNVLLYFSVFMFVAISFGYFMKFIKYREAVKKEFAHPIRINFFPAMSISLLLFSIAFYKVNYTLSGLFWYIGAPLHLFFTLYVIRYWIVNNLDIKHSNPAWFIPIVGNVLVPITGVDFGGVAVAQFYFSIGIFFWVVLFTMIFYRIIFHHQLAEKFLPTLFIFIAPAAVGYISYVKMVEALSHITGNGISNVYMSLDFFGHMLYDVGMFFTLLVFFMFGLFARVKYAITWWAYTFPMAAITIASMVNYHLTKMDIEKGIIKNELVFKVCSCDTFFFFISNVLIAITTILIAYVAIFTVKAALKKEICIEE